MAKDKGEDSVIEKYIPLLFAGKMTAEQIQKFLTYLKIAFTLFAYDKVPLAFCQRCRKQLRWTPQFGGLACCSADGGCGWKLSTQKVLVVKPPDPPKPNKHSGDTTVLSFKP